jgi:DNA polymerase-3 subunit epsilon
MVKQKCMQATNGKLRNNKNNTMNYLVYDTETNGFPPHARMTQLAFMLFNDKSEVIMESQDFIKPDGWTIPKTEFFINNGMTTERNVELGIPLKDCLAKFHLALEQADYKIAHNHQFDVQIVTNEIAKAGMPLQTFANKKHFCTMLASVDYVGALNKWGKPGKWPNLQELHKKCFGEEFDGAHDALADVRATAKSFIFLKEKGIIKI